MTPSPDTELSSCCRAPMIVVGDSFGEGTNHYECTKCGKACDRAIIKPKPAMRYVDEDGYQDAPKSISPTENTEELAREAIRERFLEMWGVDTRSEVEMAMVEQETDWVLSLIDQAVQAFGEKVLEEVEKLPLDCRSCGYRTFYLEADLRNFNTGLCANCGADSLATGYRDVSVITSLMKGEVR